MDNKINKIIETQCQSLSSDVSYKLKQARAKALHNSSSKSAFFTAWYIPTTAIAALAIYFTLPLIQQNNESVIIDQESFAVITEMDTLDQIDLIENLEFYEWLSLEENMSSI